MKTIRAFIISIMIFFGIAGCSTTSQKVASSQQPVSTTAETIEEARLLYESGKMDAAEKELNGVLAVEPKNPKANYYLAIVQQCRANLQEQQTKPNPFGYYPTYPPKPIY